MQVYPLILLIPLLNHQQEYRIVNIKKLVEICALAALFLVAAICFIALLMSCDSSQIRAVPQIVDTSSQQEQAAEAEHELKNLPQDSPKIGPKDALAISNAEAALNACQASLHDTEKKANGYAKQYNDRDQECSKTEEKFDAYREAHRWDFFKVFGNLFFDLKWLAIVFVIGFVVGKFAKPLWDLTLAIIARRPPGI